MTVQAPFLGPVVSQLCESPTIRELAEASRHGDDFYNALEAPHYRELLRQVILDVASQVADSYVALARAAASIEDDRHPALMDALAAAHLHGRSRGLTYTCVYGRCGGASITTTESGIAGRWMDAHVEEHPHSADYSVTFRIDSPIHGVGTSVEYRDAVKVDEATTFSYTGPLVPDVGGR